MALFFGNPQEEGTVGSRLHNREEQMFLPYRVGKTEQAVTLDPRGRETPRGRSG